MALHHITVFLPCHSLGDVPTWLEEGEADDLLASWTAAWHPGLIAAVGRKPEWASIDAPPHDLASAIGIVPACFEERFATQIDPATLAASHWVRGTTGREAIVAAAREAAGLEWGADADGLADDFHALGLAWLLAELLARRMRSQTSLESSGFEQAVVQAAQAAVAGDHDAARARLQECYSALEVARSHYYPVDVWLLDLVLLAPSTLGAALDEELDAPVPLGVVATGALIQRLAQVNPAAMARLRQRVADGSVSPVGGRFDARPLDLCTAEEIEASFEDGMAIWREQAGRAPATFGQIAGGSSAMLPRLLQARGYGGVIWNLFDGTALPDPGASRILWEGTEGGRIDAVARLPLDAREARTVLALAERIGDAMDHDHTVVLQFAHYPGTASRWHGELRRIASWGKSIGEFVAPDEFFRRTAGAGMSVDFPSDAFPVTLPVEGRSIRDQVAAEVASATRAATRIATHREATVSSRVGTNPSRPQAMARPSGWLGTIASGLFSRRRVKPHLVLDNGAVRVQVHEATGGLLAIRVPGDIGNRVSQRLAMRTTRPAPTAGQPWEDVHERAVHSGMVADTIDRAGDVITSSGRLVAADGRVLGSFVQRVSLGAGLPLVLLEMEVQSAGPLVGPPLESYAACRFAWHENEMPDLLRSLHLRPVVTERWRFTAPHFIEIRPTASRCERPPTQIFTYGLPWHVRSGEHMLDSILPADDRAAIRCRMAIGVGIDRVADMAIDLMAATGGPAAS